MQQEAQDRVSKASRNSSERMKDWMSEWKTHIYGNAREEFRTIIGQSLNAIDEPREYRECLTQCILATQRQRSLTYQHETAEFKRWQNRKMMANSTTSSFESLQTKCLEVLKCYVSSVHECGSISLDVFLTLFRQAVFCPEDALRLEECNDHYYHVQLEPHDYATLAAQVEHKWAFFVQRDFATRTIHWPDAVTIGEIQSHVPMLESIIKSERHVKTYAKELMQLCMWYDTLDMTMNILRMTGIGLIMNNVRKKYGTVLSDGLVKVLVEMIQKWKALVVHEQDVRPDLETWQELYFHLVEEKQQHMAKATSKLRSKYKELTSSKQSRSLKVLQRNPTPSRKRKGSSSHRHSCESKFDKLRRQHSSMRKQKFQR